MVVRTRSVVRFLAALALPLSACVGTCNDAPREVAPAASAPSGAPSQSASSRAPSPLEQTHRITFQDHRHVVPLRVDDRIALPDDPAFRWRVDFEDKSAGERVNDAGEGTYRMTKPGAQRIMVFGDPKACLDTDAACTVSKRRWDVTLAVQ